MKGFRSEDFLKLIGAVDTTSRHVGKRETIKVRCVACQKTESEQLMQVLQQKAHKKNEGWRCAPCGFASAAQIRSDVDSSPGHSRKSSAFRTQEVLEMAKAVDITPRIIRADELLAVRCWDCEAAGEAKMNNQIQRLKNKGYTWRCPDCVTRIMSKRASEKTGHRNSFYGKTHSEETKELIGIKQSQRLASVSFDDKKAISDKARAIAYDKYGGNPMSNEEIRQKHHEATHSKDFIEWSRKNGLSLVTEEFRRFMKETSEKYWASPEGTSRKTSMSEFYTTEFNSPGGRFYESRKRCHGLYLADTAKVDEMVIKGQETSLSRYGVKNVMQDPEIRRRALRKRPATTPEKYICEMLLQRGIPFDFQEELNGKNWDFCIYDENRKLKLIVEVDGEYNHGLAGDPFFKTVGGHKDNERFSKVPDGVNYLEVDGKRVKEAIPAIITLLGVDYFQWISDIFTECSTMSFPYPEYDANRMYKDWENLCRLYTDKMYPTKIPCNSIITSFHKSIYTSRVGSRKSPVEAWSDPELLLQCIENRFVYKASLSSQQIARGFERNKIAPRVTVFQPSLARYLLAQYAKDAKTVIDPFSGFSGRMLGALSLGMEYTGYDIRQEVINESNSILSFLGLSANLKAADFNTNTDQNEYDVLITCPPYRNKERWFDGQVCRSAEWYIEECLKKFKAKTYIFVVDETVKFSNDIKEVIGRRSHISDSSEKIVIINKP